MKQLHDYQVRAVSHVREHGRAGLFMQMGAGKTATVLRALEPRHLPALVVAPKRVAEMVWPEEGPDWAPHLSMAVAVGTADQRQAALQSSADLVVIGRDTLKDVPLKNPWRTVVLDELSSFKSHTSARFKAARRFTKDVPHVWGLTGTPAPNGYLDLWSQLFLLDRGERLGRSVTGYRERYFTPDSYFNGNVTSWRLRPGARERIDSLISDICMSVMTADFLDMPEPLINTVLVPNPVAGIYRRMKTDLVAGLELLGPDSVHTAANAAVLSGRLSQITAGFLYSDRVGGAPTRLHSEKTKVVREIVDGTGSPVLVFYRFQEEAEELLRALPEAVTIDRPNLQRDWNAGELPVLIAHPDAIGHGLNLQKGPGHTEVFTSLPWSLEAYQQSVGRLARQGQARRVTVHHLIMPGTVDDVIATALVRKESVQTALLRYLA